jgi:hypothetical protein
MLPSPAAKCPPVGSAKDAAPAVGDQADESASSDTPETSAAARANRAGEGAFSWKDRVVSREEVNSSNSSH